MRQNMTEAEAGVIIRKYFIDVNEGDPGSPQRVKAMLAAGNPPELVAAYMQGFVEAGVFFENIPKLTGAVILETVLNMVGALDEKCSVQNRC